MKKLGAILGAAVALVGCAPGDPEVVPPKVVVDPSAAWELENSTLVELYALVGKSVAGAEALIGYPDRLAGALTTDGVLVLEADTEAVSRDKTRIVTGFCWKRDTPQALQQGRRAGVPDRLALVTVDARGYRPEIVTGEGGYNNFPPEWAARRGCDTNSSLMIPVLNPRSSASASPGVVPTS